MGGAWWRQIHSKAGNFWDRCFAFVGEGCLILEGNEKAGLRNLYGFTVLQEPLTRNLAEELYITQKESHIGENCCFFVASLLSMTLPSKR